MLLRPHKADLFIANEPEYATILVADYADYLSYYVRATSSKEYPSTRLQTSDFPIWLDIGAHIGTASLKIARHGASMIFAIEPEPFNFSLLQQNTKEFDNVLAMNYAIVGSTEIGYPDAVAMAINLGENSGRHSVAHTLARTHTTHSLMVRALPFFYVSQMSCAKCAKIDVEGAEHLFLMDMLNSELEFIIMEYHLDANVLNAFSDTFYSLDSFKALAIKAGWQLRVHSSDDKYKTHIITLRKSCTL